MILVYQVGRFVRGSPEIRTVGVVVSKETARRGIRLQIICRCISLSETSRNLPVCGLFYCGPISLRLNPRDRPKRITLDCELRDRDLNEEVRNFSWGIEPICEKLWVLECRSRASDWQDSSPGDCCDTHAGKPVIRNHRPRSPEVQHIEASRISLIVERWDPLGFNPQH